MAAPSGDPVRSEDITNVLMRRMIKTDPKFKIVTYMEEFKGLLTNPERIDFVYKHLQKANLLPTFIKDKKSDEVSIGHRERANVSFVASKYSDALEIYTTSIAEAKSKHALSLGYAGRSACLFQLNLHKECLMDIDRALANNYPNNLKPELLARQEHSKNKLQKNWKFHEAPPTIPESQRHPRFQCASDSIGLKNDAEAGLHIVATKDIQIGEVLTVERPFSRLATNQLSIHCLQCITLCYNPIPCPRCTQAWYCSDECMELAFQTYHKYECPLLLSLYLLAVESSVRFALKLCFLVKDQYEEIDGYLIDESEAYHSDRYKEIYCLRTYIDRKPPPQDFHAKAAVSAMVFHMVKKHTSFFAGLDNKQKKLRMERRFKDLLLLQIRISHVSGCAVTELCPTVQGLSESETFGGCVYPLMTFFNCSYSPNVGEYFHGDTLVLRASSVIREGERCLVSYPHSIGAMKHTILFEPVVDRILDEVGPEGHVELKERLVQADVKAAKKLLFHLVPLFSSCEQADDEDDKVLVLRELICQCYRVLGNKRRV